MGVFSTIFRRRSAHPLADARRGERLAAAVRASANPLEVATTAADWLEAAAADDALTATEVARIGQLAQEASQGAMRTLAQQYVSVGVRTPAEQARAWSALNRFHVGAAACFDAALARVAAGTDVRMELPRMAICALRSSAAQLKWLHVGREPVDETLWNRAYRVFALAERLGILGSRAKAFADDDRTSTPQQEFARLVALAIASPGSLRLAEIQALDDLIAAAASGFTIGPRSQPEATHWLDLAAAEAPMRIARPPRPADTVRFFCGADAMDFLYRLAVRIDERDAIPEEFRRELDYGPTLAKAMIEHLRRYCGIDAATRKAPRHRLDSRLEVIWGFDEILDRLQPDRSLAFLAAETDEWLMEDAGAGGVKAVVSGAPRGWLQIGALVAVRAPSAARWQVGVVRRLLRARTDRTEVAVQMHAREVTPVALHAESSSTSDFGLLLDGRRARAGLMIVARPGAVNDRPFRVERDGASLQLMPIARETGPGYQIVHCEESIDRVA